MQPFPEPAYGIVRRLPDVPFDRAVGAVRAALAAEGFGVITEIDVQDTFRRKLDVESPPYVILGACNPKLAHRALQGDAAIGLLLPCNVVVAAEGDGSVVAAADPRAMFRVATSGGPEAVAEEARERLVRALDALAGEVAGAAT